MGLDDFGRTVRNIRLVRALLLYDMAKDLDISPAELSAIECGRKPVPIGSSPSCKKNTASATCTSNAYQIYEGTG